MGGTISERRLVREALDCAVQVMLEVKDESPLRVVQAWIEEARALGVKDPDAMTLATVHPDGAPSARIVLCRALDDESITFFTNYESAKGKDLAANARVAAVFYWRELNRQVRVEGGVTTASADVSDAYFAGRPRGSQIAARVSPQSQVITSVEDLLARHKQLEADLVGRVVDRPRHWGGYRVAVTGVELWRAGEFRMHERLRYERRGGSWVMRRLAP
jgi:pyridoxamine 5'-phosphate oxidase